MKLILALIGVVLLALAVQWAMCSPVFSGVAAYVPVVCIALVLGLVWTFRKSIIKLLMPALLVVLCATSLQSCFSGCSTIEPDKIGVWVQNWGKSPEDYSIVMGKAPYDNAYSTWLREFPAREISLDIPEKEIPTKNGVVFVVDPAVSFALERSDESCRKYAFKFAAYKNDEEFKQALSERVSKAARDAIINVLGNITGDSLLFNRAKAEKKIEDDLRAYLHEEFGINLTQYSVVIKPTPQLQQAIDQRLVAEQAYNTAKAKLASSEIEAQVRNNESKGLTPQILEKMRIDAQIVGFQHDYWAKQALANSQNAKIIIATSTQVPLVLPQ